MDMLSPCLVVRGRSTACFDSAFRPLERVDVSAALAAFQDAACSAGRDVSPKLVVVHSSNYFVDIGSLSELAQSVLSIRYDGGGIWMPALLAMVGASREAAHNSLLVCREIMTSEAGNCSLGKHVLAGPVNCMAIVSEMAGTIARAISAGDIKRISPREVQLTPRPDLMLRARELSGQCGRLIDQIAVR